MILRALKERDPWYIDFLSDRLISVLDKKREITLCRIPSATKDKISGCDDLINVLASKSPLLTDGSKCLQRIESIPAAHQGGKRDFDQDIKSSYIIFDKTKPDFTHKNLKFIKGDILNKQSVFKAIKGSTHVFHLAGWENDGTESPCDIPPQRLCQGIHPKLVRVTCPGE